MSTPDKAIAEKIVLSLFQKSFSDFPKGKIVKTESPDFLLKINKKRIIGIELTELLLANNFDLQKVLSVIDELKRKKEGKMNLYQKMKCYQYWLMIYVDALNDNIFKSLVAHFKAKPYHSVFHKMFLFELFNKSIIELTLNHTHFKG